MINAPLFRTLCIFAGFVLALYFSSSVLMPIIFSAVFAFFIYPLVRRLERFGLSLVLSSFLIVFILLVSGVAGASFIVMEGAEIVRELPTKSIENTISNPIAAIDGNVEMNLQKYDSEINTGITKMTDKLLSFVPETLVNLNQTVVFFVTCPVYIFFMLIARDSIKRFYYSSFSEEKQVRAQEIIDDAQLSYTSYLRGLSFVMLIVAVLTSAGLLALGIRSAVFFGILAGLLTIVPYLGVFISAVLPVVIALITKDSIWFSVGVVAIFVVVQFLEGNLITPKVMGEQIDINPLVIVLGIVLFGALGGIVGMVLTIPLLALVKVISEHIPAWKPIYNLLST